MADILVGDVLARLRADSTQFTQTLARAIQQLGQLNQAFTTLRQQQSTSQQALTQQAQALQQVAQSATQATAAVRQMGSGLQSAFAVAGGIGIATSIGAIVGQMKDLAVSTVQTGIRLEGLRASLSALGGGPSAGVQQFQMLTDTAQRLGVALEPLARGWRTITAAATQAGVPLADQQRLLAALATEARRVGASNEELGRIFQAMGQIFSKGKVSMEEVRQQLGEALPTALAAAARGMGQTTEAVIKLIESGTLGAASFSRALTRGLEQLQSGTGKMADTTQQALNRLITSWTTLQDTIMRSGLNTYLVQVIKNIQNAVEWTNKAVAPDPNRVGLRPLTEMGATPDQAKQIAGLERVIASYTRQAANAQNEAHRTQYTEMAARAKEQLEQVMAAVRATREQQAAQGKVTEEANKTKFALEQQADFVKDLTKALAEATKQIAEFRQKAALAPELYGRLGGTPEEAEKYRRRESEVRTKALEGVTDLIQGKAPGTIVPPAQMEEYVRLRQGLSGVEAASKAAEAAEKARAKAAREAEQAAREAEQAEAKAARQAIQDQEEYQRAIDKTRMAIAHQQDTSLETLRRLAEQYGQVKEVTDLATAKEALGQLVDTDKQAQAEAYFKTIEAVAKIEAQLPDLRREAAASAVAGAAAIKQAQDTERFEGDLASRLEQLRVPRDERETIRLRRQAERQGIDLTPQLEQQLRLIDEQTRWNTLMDHAGRISDQAAQTITNGLMRIVDGTVAVGEGFREMAKSILDSMAQVALNETFKLLFGLGLSALGGLASGGSAGFTGNTGYGLLAPVRAAEGLGPVNRPTLALIGEGPTNPEYVLNQRQINQMMTGAMHGGPSAGGQAAGNISIINVSSKEQADITAAQERAMGRQVVVNYVLEELGQGSGSRISQVMRSTLR